MPRLAALAVLLAVFTLPLGDGSEAAAQTPSQSESVIDRWARDNYRSVADELFPGGVIPTGEFPKSVRWIVTVRIESAFDGTEMRFSMRHRYDGKVEVTVTEPNGASLRAQILRLKGEHPEATAEGIAKLVSLRQRFLTDQDCPALRGMAGKFETTHISPALPDVLMMDAYGYDFWSESLYGSRMEVHLTGPGPKAKKQPHPLLAWAEAVRTMVNGQCSSAGRSQ